MTQIFYFRDTKGTFVSLGKELMMRKKLLEPIHMDDMGLPIFNVD
jgi:hypothetical protein